MPFCSFPKNSDRKTAPKRAVLEKLSQMLRSTRGQRFPQCTFTAQNIIIPGMHLSFGCKFISQSFSSLDVFTVMTANFMDLKINLELLFSVPIFNKSQAVENVQMLFQP